ncbi:MAG TPA: glycosyltransferase [Acidimicrobiales bacterium]|nr:glycosyltransferase [Acidimicrobiales bacterium]
MKRTITISIEQLQRPQPGGIATYVRGLAAGLHSLSDSTFDVVGLKAAGPSDDSLPLRTVSAPCSERLLSRIWPIWPLGVPRISDVVHATSMAGPYGGGSSNAVHSVAMHDLLWRDEPGVSTKSGIRFHERRLKLITERRGLRVIVTSPGLTERLVEVGIDESRIHFVRLGVDEDSSDAANESEVRELLASHGVNEPFTLYAGTREPRKNIERLLEAHKIASARNPELGSLVLVGPSGWGGVSTGDATVLGLVSRAMLLGLYRDATVFAYVPRAEGWGLPPVEALHAGTRVVASTTTPSVANNELVTLVDPFDVSSIAEGLVAALSGGVDESNRSVRRESVSDLTWRNVALDHLAAWR